MTLVHDRIVETIEAVELSPLLKPITIEQSRPRPPAPKPLPYAPIEASVHLRTKKPRRRGALPDFISEVIDEEIKGWAFDGFKLNKADIGENDRLIECLMVFDYRRGGIFPAHKFMKVAGYIETNMNGTPKKHLWEVYRTHQYTLCGHANVTLHLVRLEG